MTTQLVGGFALAAGGVMAVAAMVRFRNLTAPPKPRKTENHEDESSAEAGIAVRTTRQDRVPLNVT